MSSGDFIMMYGCGQNPFVPGEPWTPSPFTPPIYPQPGTGETRIIYEISKKYAKKLIKKLDQLIDLIGELEKE